VPIQSIHSNLLDWVPRRSYDLWHDRAVFHFLIGDTQRQRYLDLVKSALSPNGSVIIATFAEMAQDSVRLPTFRYSPSQLASLFGSDIRTVVSET
jgi:hypothetical protein